jgi:glucosamine-phosphate N-acetyltransferase
MLNFIYDSLLNICKKNENNEKIIEKLKNEYIHLLSFLTNTPNISIENFINQINEISKIGDIIICYFINKENKENQENHQLTIIGSGTIIYEPKIIHGCRNVGHIEDIVVHTSYRKMGISQTILEKLKEFAKNNNCYKIILDCKESVSNVYKKNNFEVNGLQMSYYF